MALLVANDPGLPPDARSGQSPPDGYGNYCREKNQQETEDHRQSDSWHQSVREVRNTSERRPPLSGFPPLRVVTTGIYFPSGLDGGGTDTLVGRFRPLAVRADNHNRHQLNRDRGSAQRLQLDVRALPSGWLLGAYPPSQTRSPPRSKQREETASMTLPHPSHHRLNEVAFE